MCGGPITLFGGFRDLRGHVIYIVHWLLYRYNIIYTYYIIYIYQTMNSLRNKFIDEMQWMKPMKEELFCLIQGKVASIWSGSPNCPFEY